MHQQIAKIQSKKKTKKNPPTKTNVVISPELIREVEARMNRNYLPPALKLANSCVGPNSPPAISVPPQFQTTACSSAVVRRYGRTCKLPTVQEVGKLDVRDVKFFVEIVALLEFFINFFFVSLNH